MNLKSALAISLLVFALCAPLALAKVTEEEAARLGEDLTPLGAEVAGEGDVPAWTGGLTGVPEGINFDPKTEHPPNPFPDDKIKYTITKKNMAEYDALLTDGHKAMLKRVPGFKMNVYQSRRSCTVPKFVQEATKRNATTVELTADGEGVTGGSVGTPFPIPQSAKELMWNNRLRYAPPKMRRQLASVVVRKGKPIEFVRYHDVSMNGWADRSWNASRLRGRPLMRRQSLVVSTRLDSRVVLNNQPTEGSRDQYKAEMYTRRFVWSGETRRVRRAPELGDDNPGITTIGISAVDAMRGFDGAVDGLDWSLVGGGAKFVPYNSYSLINAKYADLIQQNQLNPEFVRYELHRVRSVEATTGEGQNQIYLRRVLHLDEDTNTVVSGEFYDGRGNLLRVIETHMINFYHLPSCLPIAEVVYDVQTPGQYVAAAVSNEEKPINPNADELEAYCFDPSVLFIGPPVSGAGAPRDAALNPCRDQ